MKEHFYKIWTNNFPSYEGGRMGKEFYAEPDSAKAKYVLKLSRTDLARFIPLISGHNSLFYFRSKIDAEVNPSCRFCMEAPDTTVMVAPVLTISATTTNSTEPMTYSSSPMNSHHVYNKSYKKMSSTTATAQQHNLPLRMAY